MFIEISDDLADFKRICDSDFLATFIETGKKQISDNDLFWLKLDFFYGRCNVPDPFFEFLDRTFDSSDKCILFLDLPV